MVIDEATPQVSSDILVGKRCCVPCIAGLAQLTDEAAKRGPHERAEPNRNCHR
jgi:hypothetical protein